MSFKIAIIGRPNVGKSTLFNRLTGTKAALVHNIPGLTRDRKELDANIASLHFKLVDTAGLEIADEGSIEELMMKQTLFAMEEAEIILMIIDGRDGVMAMDEHFAKIVRKSNKPKILIVNKAESEKNTPGIYEAYKLGLGEPVIMSAEHGLGLGDLHDRIIEEAEKEFLDIDNERDEHSDTELSLAIIGRPNAGKSTLFNAIVREERSIASDLAGTTRDSIFEYIEHKDSKIKLYDTAGIRKKFKKGNFLEEISVHDSLKALGYANIIVLLIDAVEGIDKIEMNLISKVFEEGKGLIIAINKWDAIEDEVKNKMMEDLDIMLDYSLTQARTCEIVPLSAIAKRNRKNINKILDATLNAYKYWNTEISTSKLNEWLQAATEENIPPISAGKRVRLKFMTQTTSRPPTFQIFTSSNLKQLPDSYIRYLKNSLRTRFKIKGVPIRISIKKTKNPFANKIQKKG